MTSTRSGPADAGPPRPGDCPSFYAPYVAAAAAAGDSPLDVLGEDMAAWDGVLARVAPEREGHRYAPGKWTLREVVGHVIDAERMFAARALAFARGDQARYPSFNENDYAVASGADRRGLSGLAEELRAVRRATVLLFAGLEDHAWNRRGVANDVEFSVRGVAWIVAGHSTHHRKVLEERYLEAS